MSVRALTVLTTIITTLTLAGSASAQTLPIRELQVEKQATRQIVRKEAKQALSAVAQAQLRQATRQVIEARRVAWNCQDNLIAAGVRDSRTQASQSVWALPRSVGYRAWVASKWTSVAKGCQKTLARSIPSTNDWLTSVSLVQRIYPGTSDWLTSISRREGGHGRFVMNTQGSGCGGWLQFMSSTYWAYSDDAFADAKRRGFIIDARKNQWTDPLGQALTGAYMRYTGRDGSHWSATSWGY